MDSNGARFHLLQGRPDWERCFDAGGNVLDEQWNSSPADIREDTPYWNGSNGDITLQERVFRFPAAPADVPPQVENRRGAGRDCGDNWYWISESRNEILVLYSGSGKVGQFWPRPGTDCTPALSRGDFEPAGPVLRPQPEELAGLTVTSDHYLVAGSESSRGLLIFDLYSGGEPRRVQWPATVAFHPWDIAPAVGGGAFVLDRTSRRYWRLNRHFHVVGERPLSIEHHDPLFQLVGDAPVEPTECIRPALIADNLATAIPAADPISIDALGDYVFVLDSDPAYPDSLLWCFRCGVQFGPPSSTDSFRPILEDSQRSVVRLQGSDFAAVQDAEGIRFYIASTDGNQSFAFDATLSDAGLHLSARREYLPMRLFSGKGLVRAGNEVWYDFPNRWVRLVAQKRRRYEPLGIVLTPVLDGRTPDCVWHRVFLDACIPEGTEVVIATRWSNNPNEVERLPWSQEPPLYKRQAGSELPFVTTPGRSTFELLIQAARGRYLQAKIEMRGEERDTPRIRAVRIYYPRFSYVDRYLPGAYREDRQSASFLERLMANFEGTFTNLEDRIALAQLLLDARSAPAETLDWLAGWFGVFFDPAWSEEKRRLFLRRASEFFAWRGTIRGLLTALRLVWDECVDESVFTDSPAEAQRKAGIRVIERFRTRALPVLSSGTRSSSQLPWEPADGTSVLHQRYRTATGASAGATYPVVAITSPAAAAQTWSDFSEATLGFTPVTGTSWEPRWQAFVKRRYGNLSALTASWGVTSWTAASLPVSVPEQPGPLRDWVDFQRHVVRAESTAHRFTVLLPVRTSETGNSATQQARRNLALRIIDLEKPAHTLPAVEFYWAIFRAGFVRLGEGTVIGRGSRAPELLSPLVLGQAWLSETYLAAPASRPVIAKGCLP